MVRTESLKIRPYARLLTMLGDQLIKDEMIALMELIKNAYDADAEHVKISFQSFNNDLSVTEESKIIIEDDGNGMDDYILKEAWMNPATPDKLKRKRIKSSTDKGRIIQGEKGIGRFAIFKLGRKINIISRRQKQVDGHFVEESEDNREYVLKYDFSEYDIDFLTKGDEEKEIFLDDLIVNLEEREPQVILPVHILYGASEETRKPYGTKIIISKLNGMWNKSKLDKVYQSIIRMQPIFGDQFTQDYSVDIDIDGSSYISSEKSISDIRKILKDKSVLIVDGGFDDGKSTLSYSLDGYKKQDQQLFPLSSPEMRGISPMKDFFKSLDKRKTECGSFSFKFFVFDLDINSNSPDTRYNLDPEEKKSIKAHRVYLYRDGIRVMPYGDPEDDWLKLDMIRGTESAGHVFGNDQLVGYITISQKDNPKLRDKTNREGLIEDGFAKEDLVNLCQLILRYIRTKDFARYLIEKKEKKKKIDEAVNKPISLINKAREEDIGKKAIDTVLTKIGPKRASDLSPEIVESGKEIVNRFLSDFENAYRKEVNVLENRISTTENLAAIGLSAETAYHDARITLQEADSLLGAVIKNYIGQKGRHLERDKVVADLRPIKKQTGMAVTLMSNIQRLFPSTKNRKRQIGIHNIVKMVKNLYAKSLKDANIECMIDIFGQELYIECTDAVLLQIFINLFDNALYWLKTIERKRVIKVEINSTEQTVIFADSGPGVSKDDEPYIFEAFYSGKGEEGKGLGLYIARQLLGRYHSSIEVIDDDNKRILEGANFLLTFKNEET